MPQSKILIVEDETLVAMDIERGLKALGYSVVATGGTGLEAVRLAQEHRPDLVLMDIRLQGAMDGIEAGKQLRQLFRIPIIFLTAYADAATLQRAKAAEPFGYLLKPFEDRELHTAIEIALHKRQAGATALAQAGEALRQSEQRFRMLVESLTDYAVFLLDPQGRVISWNPGAERISGYPEKEVLGEHVSLFYRPEEVVRNRPDRLLWLAAQEGRTRDESWRVRRDGSCFWADVVITALQDEHGQLIGFAEVAQDTTEKKNAEEKVRQLNTLLEKRVQERTAELNAANQELEAFTYSVAHDLRAPLRGVGGLLSILQEDLGSRLSSEEVALVGRAIGCADQMRKLIDDLLSLSRLGRQTPRRGRVALDELARQVVAEFKIDTENRQVDWRIEALPQVECDAGLVKQVFVNLIGNALKYTRPRKIAVIRIGQVQDKGETVIFVRDNGVGFDMSQAGKLFQPFTRLHRAEDFPGTGVGLATVERIIRKHGGRIWAEAEEDKGATFCFTLEAKARCAVTGSEELELLDSTGGSSGMEPKPNSQAA